MEENKESQKLNLVKEPDDEKDSHDEKYLELAAVLDQSCEKRNTFTEEEFKEYEILFNSSFSDLGEVPEEILELRDRFYSKVDPYTKITIEMRNGEKRYKAAALVPLGNPAKNHQPDFNFTSTESRADLQDIEAGKASISLLSQTQQNKEYDKNLKKWIRDAALSQVGEIRKKELEEEEKSKEEEPKSFSSVLDDLF